METNSFESGKKIEKLEKFEYGNIQREWKIQRVENSEKEKIRN